MTEQVEQAPAAMPEVEVQFRGRAVWVRMPRPEALLIWQRTLTKLESGPAGGWTGSTVMVALERLRKIIDSILVNEVDKTWIDDEFLDGTMVFQDLVPLVNLAVEKFAELSEQATPNRAARRAKPAKKARRKAS